MNKNQEDKAGFAGMIHTDVDLLACSLQKVENTYVDVITPSSPKRCLTIVILASSYGVGGHSGAIN
ncbi:MAG: hypothetical protein ACXAC5_22105 [Promethearchaeota archaeon]|jgi:hypothetical protein